MQTFEYKRVRAYVRARACVRACLRACVCAFIACVRQPPLPFGVTAEEWARNEEIIESFFDAGAGYAVADAQLDQQQGGASTYGEVTVLGGRQLAEAMFSCEKSGSRQAPGRYGTGADKLAVCGSSRDSDTAHRDGQNFAQCAIVFYDLGSGTGRLTAQMFLDQPAVCRAVGVELSAARHGAAAEAAAQLSSSLPEAAGRVSFVHGNALTADTSDATHIFVSSLCFPAHVTEGIAERVLRSCSSGESRHLRVVAALSVLEGLERAAWPRRVEHIQTSWGSARVFMYSRPGVCT